MTTQLFRIPIECNADESPCAINADTEHAIKNRTTGSAYDFKNNIIGCFFGATKILTV